VFYLFLQTEDLKIKEQTMNYKFSASSLSKLESVDLKLQVLAKEVLKISPINFAITEGLRSKQRQAQLYREGKTKTLNSKHLDGKAIDICPIIDGKLDYSKEAEPDLYFILGLFYLKAKELNEKYELSGGTEGVNIKLRFGAFWDGLTIKQNKFVDAYHIEII
jgi:peptidoglycan L-alanyl-D-glutamate endopeptidase CwlK